MDGTDGFKKYDGHETLVVKPELYYDPANTMRSGPSARMREDTLMAIANIKANGQAFYDALAALPQSADMTLAKRKAEEAVMWAVKAVTA